MERDIRIDLIRGFAMITICFNHITWLLNKVEEVSLKIPTLTHYGYSSAAEIFFFMSGYMVGMVYLSKDDASRRLFGRALHLYKVNIILFLFLLLFASFSNKTIFLHLTDLDYFIEHPILSLFKFVTFSYGPMFTNLLFTYVFLLLLAIPLTYILRRNTVVFLFLISCLYIVSQIFPHFKLNNIATIDGKWSFNTFSYQFIFMLGVMLGYRRFIALIFEKMDKNSLFYAVISISVLVVFYAIKRYDLLAIKGEWWLNKGSLGPVRILHFFVVMAVLMSLLTLFKSYLTNIIMKFVALIGRQSLATFCASVVCAYAALLCWVTLPKTQGLYILTSILSIFIIGLVAYEVEWLKEKRKN